MIADSGIESGSSPEMLSTNSMDLHHRLYHHQYQSPPSPQPMSRTHQYRKVMKPLLERKRRARINKCLDELKDIMVGALQTEGESITKLEKADVLELTVKHLRKLKRQNALGLTPQATYAGKFKAGYSHCAQEVTKFMSGPSVNLDVHVSTKLLSHLGTCIQALDTISPSVLAASSSSASPSASYPSPFYPSLSQTTSTEMAMSKPAAPLSTVSLLRMQRNFARRPGVTSGKCEDKAWRPW